jgi:hypothetical protein
MKHGFIRVGAGIPEVRVADAQFNVEEIEKLILKSQAQGVELLKMAIEDIFAMVDKVFQANYKSDRFFGKTDMWSGRTKPYTISF